MLGFSVTLSGSVRPRPLAGLNEGEGLVVPFHVFFPFPLLRKTQLFSAFCVISPLYPSDRTGKVVWYPGKGTALSLTIA